jgi:hypothetical protein
LSLFAAAINIIQLSDEAHEVQNKNYKNYRKHHTRKNSRINTNEHIGNTFFFVLSDPYISSMRNVEKKTFSTLPDEVKSLLILKENFSSINDDETSNFETE